MSAPDKLTSVLKSSAAHTRLLARLVICCLHPITDDSHTKLLELTVEESKLLLSFIKRLEQPGGLDPVRLLKAASILFREFPSQTLSGHLIPELCESVINELNKNHNNCVLEGALCLLWSLVCFVPEAKHHVSKIDNFVSVLTLLQRSPCSIVSSPARSILFVSDYGNSEGKMGHTSYYYTLLYGVSLITPRS